MKNKLLPLLVGASMAFSSPTLPYTIGNSKEEISQTLSLDEDEVKMDDYHRRQLRIQRLISQIKEPIILGNLHQPDVSITIDDGYGKESIEYVLNLFEKQGVKATFFVIGTNLKQYPDLWEKAVEQGHEICNHTSHHDKYFKTGNEAERFESELLGWEKDVKQVLGEDYFARMKKDFPFFRFPGMYGIRVKAYLDILKKHGYIPIGWSNTENPKDGVVNNGDIYLWHFNNKDTLNVRKNLFLILQNNKCPRTVSDIITSEDYDEPIGWHNVYKKKNKAKK